MQNLQTLHTYLNKQPRGFDLLIGPNQKTFGTQRHNKCLLNKRQGASTFQKVRTKKTSAPKGTTSANQMPRGFDLSKGPNQKTFGTKRHNKCKPNAKGLRPFKRPEPKNLRHKRYNKSKTKGLRPFFQKARIKSFGTKTQ